MSRRPLPRAACLLVLACPLAAGWLAQPGEAQAAKPAIAKPRAAKLTAANWDASAQREVLAAGAMTDEPGVGFAGAAPLSAQADDAAMAALAAQEQLTAVAVAGDAPVTVVGFDARLVDELGLGALAEQVQQAAVQAGLQPPWYFGSEVLARYLGLRYEHAVGEQALDLYPSEAITRAEAAHSFARVLEMGSWALAGAQQTFSSFALPAYSPSQLEVLRIAVSKIGMPYVWGGTTDNTADGLEHGGYDCSGFVWRVYKVSELPWGQQILGRTAAQQAGEIPRSSRIPLAAVQGGDLLFFGTAHFTSRATEANVIHEAIALSSEWAINSSGQGVEVQPLTSGWLAESFTWARRVL